MPWATETTLRLGRLLAPYAIRYIVVPVADGAASTIKHPLPIPSGLTDALDDQLDPASPLTSPLNYIVYENTAWIPDPCAVRRVADADATRQAGPRLARTSRAAAHVANAGCRRRRPTMPMPRFAARNSGADHRGGRPSTQRWTLHVGRANRRAAARRSVSTTGYDISSGGSGRASLSHR